MALLILVTLAGIQLSYWWYYFRRVSRYDVLYNGQTAIFPPVSIVICFKGLPEDFFSRLTAITNQKYTDKEIILVNDFSSDEDVRKITEFINTSSFKGIKLIPSTKDVSGKKQAILDGIAAASFDYILFTDIDCKPASGLWTQKMMEKMVSEKADVVLGYGPMESVRTPVAWFSGFETVMTAMLYFGFHLAGESYMSVGRNWLVKKQRYLDVQQKIKGKNLPSGDDDLTLQALVAEKARITCCLDADTFMYSSPKKTFFDFMRQKSRHISTSVVYPVSISAKLFLFSFALMAMYVCSVLFLWFGWLEWTMLVLLFAVKWFLQMMIHYKGFTKLKAGPWILLYPVGEILLALYYPVLAVYRVITKTSW